jgi:hypothetical protein
MVFIPRLREHGLDHVEIAKLGRAEIGEHGIVVILRMDARVTSAMEGVGIVLALPMVGQRLPRDLPPCDAAPVGESCDEQRVDRAILLNHVEHLLDALIDERDCTDLYADHFAVGERRGGRGKRARRGRLQEVSALHRRSHTRNHNSRERRPKAWPSATEPHKA